MISASVLAFVGVVAAWMVWGWMTGEPTDLSRTAAAGGSTLPAIARLDFETEIQPFFVAHCADCHGEDFPEAGLNLARYDSVDSILEDRQTWEKVEKLIRIGAMPPPDMDQPPEEDRNQIVEWLDHQLYYVDCSADLDPGRVTVRRLNQTEYRNTIRDLLGVDFDPSRTFPSDDVGYGFDNIGDVLTIPPLLVEKYLDAAETISLAAIQAPESLRIHHKLVGAEMKHSGSAKKGPYASAVMPSRGRAFETVRVAVDGEYTLRVEAAADQAGDEPAKMELTAGPDFSKIIEIKSHKKPEEFEFQVVLSKGSVEISGSFINDFYDEKAKGRKDRNLYLKSIELEGPAKIAESAYRESHRRLITVTPADGVSPLEAAQANFRQFLPRAFRRPVREEEVEKFAAFVPMVMDRGESFESGMQIALQAVLVSPQFLFRTEGGTSPGRPGTAELLDDYALASRLSYFLWSSMPDKTLFDLAAAGQLHKLDVLKEQTLRMLADERADELVRNFSGQWLGLRKLSTNEVAPDPKLFPEYDETLRDDMWKETELFFGSIVRDNRSVYDLLTARDTFVNERLARHYGLEGIEGEEFRRVELPEGQQRAGLLTHASILTLTSYPTRTSPVKRGQWVLENLLGDEPPEAPPVVPALDETQEANPNLSFREQLELHRADPGCASCHKLMDDIGFGLQNFDAIGRWRVQDGEFPVDANGTLPTGESFEGPLELIGILGQRREEFARCLAEKMLTYALGRGVEYYDKCTIDSILMRLADDDRFASLAVAIVTSEPFRMRRSN